MGSLERHQQLRIQSNHRVGYDLNADRFFDRFVSVSIAVAALWNPWLAWLAFASLVQPPP
jgi:hypothetical protein